VNTNSSHFFSYREILIHAFGEKTGADLFLMDKAQLESILGRAANNRSARFVAPTQVVNPANNLLAGIGTKMINSRTDYESKLKVKLGPENRNLRV